MLCTVTSLILGVLLGAVLHYLITRARAKPPTPSQEVTYEEVDIHTTTQGTSGQRLQNIKLDPNEAYDDYD